MKTNIEYLLVFILSKRIQKTVNKYPTLHDGILTTIQELNNNPFSANLKTHKLKGDLEGIWACSINYNLRIIFNLAKNSISQETDIILIDIGTHEEVY